MFDELRRDFGKMGIAVDEGRLILHRGGGDDGIGIGQATPRLLTNCQRGGDDLLGDRQRVGKKLGIAGENFLAGVRRGNNFFQARLKLQPGDGADVSLVAMLIQNVFHDLEAGLFKAMSKECRGVENKGRCH